MNYQIHQNQPSFQLRPPTLKDTERIAELFPSPDVQRFLGLPPFESYTVQNAETFLRDSLRRKKQEMWDGRALCVNDELIGMIDAQILFGEETALLGFWLGKPYWGRGMMTAALGQFVQILFNDHASLNVLQATVQTENHASAQVFVKNGFTQTTRREGLQNFTRKRSKEG